MKSIEQIRDALGVMCPDALVHIPGTQGRNRGHYPTVQVWGGLDELEREVLAPQNLPAQALPDAEDDRPIPRRPCFEFSADAEPPGDTGMGSEVDEELRAERLVEGTDAYAWYVSFHHDGAQWGIYIPTSSLASMSREFFGDLSLDWPSKLKLSAHVLHQHELFHFSMDYMSALWEMTTSDVCWRLRKKLRGPLGHIELEEQLANAQMLRQLGAMPTELKVAGRAAALRKLMAESPAGYRDGPSAVSSAVFHEGCLVLANRLVAHASHDGWEQPRELFDPILEALIPVEPTLDWRYCPVHVIKDEARYGLPELGAGLSNQSGM